MISRHVDSLGVRARESLACADSGGAKVVGYLPGGYVPEELIYASGARPVCLVKGGDGDLAGKALSVVPSVICPFARTQIAALLCEQDPLYRRLDLVVVPSTCQHLKKIGDIWEYYEGPKVFKLGVPYDPQDDTGLEYYRDRLVALKERLESVTGASITDERLAEAVRLYDRMRELLRTVSRARRAADPPLSAHEFAKLNHASLVVDPAIVVETLESICQELPSETSGAGVRPRLLLVGPNLAAGDDDLLSMTHDAGADIVVEDIFEGIRDHGFNVGAAAGLDLGGRTSGDLVAAIARAYLRERPPAAFMRGSSRGRLEAALRLIEDFRVSGVLWYQLLCCEFYDEEGFFFQKALTERDTPMLVVESDYRGLEAGQLKTRLEAFVEMLQGGLGDA